ncbi:DUF5706 domain-containing protein [Cytophagaceae bacterium DM2B3-1]|uniref:DUF5706 domain-containing protein n=1 Tax=Xanthocytophaga flava TaxID=3048013 RepID=A0ABT7CYT3_9BACT|nr:Pycsar system effector family protein [Xanthocytophaga flavus]MDJ1498945.1 DUF5706 domain-containing protein [Xanthocytophaga flavus]
MEKKQKKVKPLNTSQKGGAEDPLPEKKGLEGNREEKNENIFSSPTKIAENAQESLSNERERLLLCVGRFDHFYDSINNKSAVFLAVATFVVGGLFTLYSTFWNKPNYGWEVHILILLDIILGLAIMVIVILAATPFLTSSKSNSLYYFLCVATYDIQQFGKLSMECTCDNEITDLRVQVYQLAKGLRKKFKRLKIAGILFLIQFALFLPITLLLIFNLNAKKEEPQKANTIFYASTKY